MSFLYNSPSLISVCDFLYLSQKEHFTGFSHYSSIFFVTARTLNCFKNKFWSYITQIYLNILKFFRNFFVVEIIPWNFIDCVPLLFKSDK
jgi:hypothetical protein